MDHHFMMWSIVESITHTQQEMEQGDHTNTLLCDEGNVEILNIIIVVLFWWPSKNMNRNKACF